MNVLTLPRTITAAELEKLAAPDETHAVRLIARRVAASVPYTLHGKSRRYVLAKDHTANAHILDIPVSVWMAGAPTGGYVDNLSISHDIQGNRFALKAPLILQVVPWKGAKPTEKPGMPAAEKAQPLAALRDLAETFGAPPEILTAIDLVASPLNPADVELQLRDIRAIAIEKFAQAEKEAPPAPAVKRGKRRQSEGPPKSNAERQREFRAKKKAEREAAKAAAEAAKNTQPPA